MKLYLGILLGLIIGGGAGFALGYNEGRGAPLFMNPFEEYTIEDDVEHRLDKFLEDTRKAIHDATR